jgi:enoyl-CoA hydratase
VDPVVNPKDYQHIKVEIAERILTATLNRPEQLNPIDNPTERELIDILYKGCTDPSFDVMVITGSGRAFSAGGDIGYMQKVIDNPSLFVTHTAKRTVFALLDFPKPLIAKVNGHAIGLGATIALFCDVIFASANAKIGDPHVNVGYVAGDGGAVIWPQLIGFARAKEYLMTGDLLTAAEAERIGLINHCVAPEELDARVDAFAKRLANGATQAIAYTKQSVNVGLKQIATAVMDASIAYEKVSSYSADHQEAVKAFLEKRKPQFTGK